MQSSLNFKKEKKSPKQMKSIKNSEHKEKTKLYNDFEKNSFTTHSQKSLWGIKEETKDFHSKNKEK